MVRTGVKPGSDGSAGRSMVEISGLFHPNISRLYVPRTQMTLGLIGKGLVWGGFPSRIGHWGSR